MSKKIILLCGPKRCGKNKLIDYVQKRLMSKWTDASCKIHLYKLVQTIFLIDETYFWYLYNDDNLKELPVECFKVNLSEDELIKLETILHTRLDATWIRENTYQVWLSIRQAMVYVSEILIKPRLNGHEYLGLARLKQIKSDRTGYIFYDDSSSSFEGQSSELVGLKEYFGENNILLIQITGRGTFSVGDSRNYHAPGVVNNQITIDNIGTEEQFLEEGFQAIVDFLYDV